MTWNYRVIRHKEGHLALHEVYYNEAGQPRAYSQQPVTFKYVRVEETWVR
jgi:hypothetical protein